MLLVGESLGKFARWWIAKNATLLSRVSIIPYDVSFRLLDSPGGVSLRRVYYVRDRTDLTAYTREMQAVSLLAERDHGRQRSVFRG